MEKNNLLSQRTRSVGPEVDALWIGVGNREEDLAKPHILIDSTAGDSHPGSVHLHSVSDAAKDALNRCGAIPAQYTVTDICDGVATGHAGMNYSLVSRDIIAAMVEIHTKASGYDGLLTISSCDKAVPGHLMAQARLDLPGVHLPGGSMAPGPGYTSADTCYETNLRVAEGAMSLAEEMQIKLSACPSCGACQYMGTASTMQCMAEALGMALPGSAIAPANSNIILQYAAASAEQVAENLKNGLTARQILTRGAFENAIKVHAAIGGSANAILHLPAIARECGIEITMHDFEKLTEDVPLLTDIQTAGKWPTQFLWYAGGIPAIMRELKGLLNLDVLTCTGKTVGENLEALEQNGFFRRAEQFMGNYGMTTGDIIKTMEHPVRESSGLRVLYGNLTPDGAIIKQSALDESQFVFTGRARVFDNEESAEDAIYSGEIKPGDVVIVRYVGKKANGMPEMLKATDAICNKADLISSTALITDGRFSGASRGPCVGYLLPEAAEGGPIALVEDEDIITIDLHKGTLDLVGAAGESMQPEQIEQILAERRSKFTMPVFKHEGALRYLDVF